MPIKTGCRFHSGHDGMNRVTSLREKINVILEFLYLAKLPCKSEREVKRFLDKKCIGFTTTKLSLNNPLKSILQEEEK